MKITISPKSIELNKVLNPLDELVLDFVSILDNKRVSYVLVSGYVSILFGRNRSSEDIDIIIKKIDEDSFNALWNALSGKFVCLNTSKKKEAYRDYLCKNNSIRFSRKNEFIPNIEIKFPREELDEWTLTHRRKVLFNKRKLHISQIELQIAYKLYLGSKKDIEDARYLYRIFEKTLDRALLERFSAKLKTQRLLRAYLK